MARIRPNVRITCFLEKDQFELFCDNESQGFYDMFDDDWLTFEYRGQEAGLHLWEDENNIWHAQVHWGHTRDGKDINVKVIDYGGKEIPNPISKSFAVHSPQSEGSYNGFSKEEVFAFAQERKDFYETGRTPLGPSGGLIESIGGGLIGVLGFKFLYIPMLIVWWGNIYFFQGKDSPFYYFSIDYINFNDSWEANMSILISLVIVGFAVYGVIALIMQIFQDSDVKNYRDMYQKEAEKSKAILAASLEELKNDFAMEQATLIKDLQEKELQLERNKHQISILELKLEKAELELDTYGR
ncbi:MAG: hypothetical protein IKC13_02790 [Elusimicrobiaceae bacterium]|nr:hypothetical protein [Elusimicrobiaceae bacterium]